MKKISKLFKSFAGMLLIPVIGLVALMTYAELTGQFFTKPQGKAWEFVTDMMASDDTVSGDSVSANAVSENDVSGEAANTTQTVTRQEITAATTTWKSNLPNVAASQSSMTGDETNQLEVHFLDVGQGDCILIKCGNESMLIDAGNNSQGTNVQNYLTKHGAGELKYAIATHPDADHIGGLDVVLYKIKCETLIMPDKANHTKTYEELMEVLSQKSIVPVRPVVGATYKLGDASFQILAPGGDYGDPNNCSVAILLTHGNNRFLFSGDAGYESDQAMLETGINLDVDVYKVSHHGSKSGSSEAFVNALSPTYAIISVGTDNDYGHPHAEVLNRLRSYGCNIFRTDEQGTIVALSDGQSLQWNAAPTESWKAGEPKAADESGDVSVTDFEPVLDGTTFVCNTNTMKFHKVDCDSVSQIYMSNRLDVTDAREKVIAQGYEPCGKCNP